MSNDQQDDSSRDVDSNPNEETESQSTSLPGSGIDETVDEIQQRTVGGIEETVEFDSPSQGGSLASDDEAEIDATPHARARGASVMTSANISQTIDPRELSKQDAAFWGSAAIGASNANRDEQTKLSPAVERSISESKLQIRKRELAVPTRDPNEPSDYRLVKLLGRGGMGNVYVAKQASLDRMIAVKVIKPLSKDKRESLRASGRLDRVESDRRQQFLSEAVVTGDLDHPNIVPIHDIALAADDTLFYAMKRVVGKPWLKTIDDMSRDENLDVLLKVCDAIAFAHTRGVVHRDIKPENIMLGDFGEVLVMDWGLAIAKPEFEKRDSITFNAGLGGTPAFMAPEMALGPVEKIGPESDIYLLGATLYYIITGHPPHKAENVSQCIRAVASNEIQSFDPHHQGELMEIALKAMATDPADRFCSVKDLQSAIRLYRSHAESIAIAATAETEYEQAKASKRYESFSRATHGFEQAIALWGGNEKAQTLLEQCQVDHARAAYQNGDYDLGLSLLDAADPQHRSLIQQLRDGLKLRQQRASRLRLFRRLVAASLAVIIIGGSIAIYFINRARTEADRQRTFAVEQRDEAKRQTKIAQDQTKRAQAAEADARTQQQIAEEQKLRAEDQTKLAEQRRTEAVESRDAAVASEQRARVAEDKAIKSAMVAKEQRRLAVESERLARVAQARAEYESYLSQIGLAKARIDGNEFDDARRILNLIRQRVGDDKLAWEWRYLWTQANQSDDLLKFDSGVVDLDLDNSSGFAVAVCRNGAVHRLGLSQQLVIDWSKQIDGAMCSAIHGELGSIMIGLRDGSILELDPDDGHLVRRWLGHQDAVNEITFLEDGRLLSASSDRTIAVWNQGQSTRPFRAWHIGSVVDLDAGFSPGVGAERALVVAAAVSDARSGRAVVWQLGKKGFERIGECLRHEHPVTSVVVGPQGRQVASSDSAGFIGIWDLSDLQVTDFENAIEDAIGAVNDSSSGQTRLTSTGKQATPTVAFWQAHDASVNSMRFSQSGRLLTGSDDYTVRAWNVETQQLAYSLRGHGGWVSALAIPERLKSFGAKVITGSVDGTVRTWSPSDQFNATSDAKKGERRGGDKSKSLSSTDNALSSTDNATSKPIHDDEILSARFNTRGNLLITASRDRTARIFEVRQGESGLKPLATIHTEQSDQGMLNEGTEFLAMSAQIDSRRGRLLVGNADSVIRIWDVKTGVQLGALSGTGLNDSFAISSDGQRLISGASDPDVRALVWNIDPTAKSPSVIHRLRGHDQAVTAFAANREGTMMVTGDRGGRCIVWDGDSGRAVGPPIDLFRGYRVNALMFASAGDSLWVASDNGTLTELDLSTRQPIQRLDHEGYVTGCDLSADGTQAVTLATLSKQQSFISYVTWWNLSTGESKELDRVESALDLSSQTGGTTERINSARFDAFGKRVVVCRQSRGGRTGSVTELRIADQRRRTFAFPTVLGPPQLSLLTADDRLISLNGEAAFRWAMEGMIHETSFRPHAAVVDACFTPDSRFAVTASRSLRLWDTLTGSAIDKLEVPHSTSLRCMDVCPVVTEKGYLIATCDQGGQLRLWQWINPATGFVKQHDLNIDEMNIRTVRFAPAGDYLLLGGSDGKVTIRSVVDPTVETFNWKLEPAAAITCAAFSGVGNWLAVGADDRTAWLIGLARDDRKTTRRMIGHADRIESIEVVGGTDAPIRVITASRDQSCRIWDPRIGVTENAKGDQQVDTADARAEPISGREVLVLRRHTRGLTSVDATRSGDLVVTGGRDGRIDVLNAKVN